MIGMMKKNLFGWLCRAIVLVTLVMPAVVLARQETPERETLDARLEGYPTNVTIDSHSTGMIWVLLVVLGVLVFAGLFKDARRTHLD